MKFMNRASLITLCLLAMATTAIAQAETALDRYLAKDDGYYQWEYVQTHDKTLHRVYELDVTSQKWLSEEEVSLPVWKHQVFVHVPKAFNLAKWAVKDAIVYLNGGSNQKTEKSDEALEIATDITQKVVIEIKQIPNQKMTIVGDGDTKYDEDFLVARSFEKFLETGNEEWPIYLPMVKGAVKSTDAALEYLTSIGFKNVEDIVVVGASKRGWATWLVGAVDDRVIGILPAVIDALDVDESFQKQWEASGEYYEFLFPYWSRDLPCRFLTPEGQELMSIVDPIEYQDRLAGKEKFILNAASDQLFLNTNSTHYWERVSEPKTLRYVPNAGHTLNQEALVTGFIWAKKVLNKVIKTKTVAPDFYWERNEETSTLTVYTSRLPLVAKFWSAQNDVRDFRLEVVGEEAWTSENISLFDMKHVWMDKDGNGLPELWLSFERKLDAPDQGGFEANMFSLNFGINTYSTSVYMTPDVLPYEGQHCQ